MFLVWLYFIHPFDRECCWPIYRCRSVPYKRVRVSNSPGPVPDRWFLWVHVLLNSCNRISLVHHSGNSVGRSFFRSLCRIELSGNSRLLVVSIGASMRRCIQRVCLWISRVLESLLLPCCLAFRLRFRRIRLVYLRVSPCIRPLAFGIRYAVSDLLRILLRIVPWWGVFGRRCFRWAAPGAFRWGDRVPWMCFGIRSGPWGWRIPCRFRGCGIPWLLWLPSGGLRFVCWGRWIALLLSCLELLLLLSRCRFWMMCLLWWIPMPLAFRPWLPIWMFLGDPFCCWLCTPWGPVHSVAIPFCWFVCSAFRSFLITQSFEFNQGCSIVSVFRTARFRMFSLGILPNPLGLSNACWYSLLLRISNVFRIMSLNCSCFSLASLIVWYVPVIPLKGWSIPQESVCVSSPTES